MAVICNKFDARIKDFSDIQSFKQYDDKYIGKLGYFSDSFCAFQDLDECLKTTLSDITDDIKDNEETSDYIFITEDCGNYRFFLPEELLREPKKEYRPFTLKEFLRTFNIGDLIELRRKDNGEVKHAMFIEYVEDNVMIGIHRFTLPFLFENYELLFNGCWKPFGIKE